MQPKHFVLGSAIANTLMRGQSSQPASRAPARSVTITVTTRNHWSGRHGSYLWHRDWLGLDHATADQAALATVLPIVTSPSVIITAADHQHTPDFGDVL